MTKSIQTKEYAYLVEHMKRARIEAGLTQVEVAKKIGRPQSHISNIESGQSILTSSHMKEEKISICRNSLKKINHSLIYV